MILEDRMDIAGLLSGKPSDKPKPGGNRPGLIYQSSDGIRWERPQLSYDTVEHYFGKELSRSERPHILWKNGQPEYLFLANHEHSHAGFFLKIKDWDPTQELQNTTGQPKPKNETEDVENLKKAK